MDVFPASLLGRRRGASGPDGKEGLTTQPPGASGFSFQGLALSAEPCDKALAVTVHWHLRLDSAWGSSWVLAAIQLLATSGSGALAPLSTGLWPPGRRPLLTRSPGLGPGPATTNCVTLGRCVVSVGWTVVCQDGGVSLLRGFPW